MSDRLNAEVVLAALEDILAGARAGSRLHSVALSNTRVRVERLIEHVEQYVTRAPSSDQAGGEQA